MEKNQATRLGIIVYDYPKLTEEFVVRTVRLLAQMGYNQRVYSVQHTHDRLIDPDELERLRQRTCYLPGKGWLIFLSAWTALKLLCLHPSGLFRSLRLFFQLLFAANHRNQTLAGVLYGQYLAVNYLLPYGISHLCCIGSGAAGTLGAVAAQASGADLNIFAAAGDLFTQTQTELLVKANVTSFMLVKSEYDRQYLSAIKGIQPRIYTFFPGVDLEQYSFPKKIRVPKPPYRLLLVGGLNAKNNQPVILEALARLKQQNMDWTFTVVGGKNGEAALLRQAKELGIQDRVRLAGILSPGALLAEFQRSHLLLAGSRITATGDRHDMPDAIVEAMALGIPVVAERNGAIAELLEHEETGLMVEPDHPEELADAIRLMLEDDITREMIIFKARLKIEGHFSHGRRIADLVDIFEENNLYA